LRLQTGESGGWLATYEIELQKRFLRLQRIGFTRERLLEEVDGVGPALLLRAQ
jgi:hypothetical protein